MGRNFLELMWFQDYCGLGIVLYGWIMDVEFTAMVIYLGPFFSKVYFCGYFWSIHVADGLYCSLILFGELVLNLPCLSWVVVLTFIVMCS